jgi:hypothetical protein
MPTIPNALVRLMNEHEVAETLGVSVATVRRWRLLRQGPRFLKVGALCKYRPEDVAGWLDTCPSGGSDPEAQ